MRLLRFLFLRLMFAGTMFFADGASALATVDGGGDAGGGDAGAGASDDAGAEGTGDDAGAGKESGEAGHGEDGQEEESGASDDPDALIATADGRKIPAKYKELFEKDKNLRADYFNQRALQKTFPGGVKEAVALARSVEELGGLDGIERIQGELSEYTADAEAFNSGDAKWTESAFKQNPELALKHFTNALGYVAENHPETYDHVGAKIIVNDLDSNLPVRDIYDILAGLKDNPAAQKAAKALSSYYNSRKDFAKKVPEKQIDPQQKKIDEQKQQLSTKEQEIRNKTINVEAAPYLTRSIESSLAAAAKAAGLETTKLQKSQPNRWGRFLKDVRNAVHADVLGDSKWLDRYDAALKSGDTAKCVRMLNARHDQAIKGTDSKPGVAAPIFHEWFGPAKAGIKKAPTGDGSAARGNESSAVRGKETPMQVNSLPPAKDINYSDPLTDKWNGIYRLKTGKLIQVKRP